RGHRDLVENSGAAMSLTQPGVWFTINDSGNDAVLYALDTTGVARGSWRIQGTGNRDWETLALGPCTDAAGAGEAAHCLYIGEIGDNDARHEFVGIHRVPEPRAQDAQFSGELGPVTLMFVY